jgi:hypothetical protein
MIIRGTKKPGINFKNNGGGPRNCILGAGQSNFGDGTGDVSSTLPVGYQQTFYNCPMCQFSTDRALKVAPLNYLDNTTYQDPVQNAGFAINIFLPVLTQAEVGGDLYSCFYSQGDTSLADDWKSTATIGAHYINMVNKFLQFKRGCFNADGVNPVCKFFVWDQGEKDGRIEVNANNYETNLTNLINNLRTAIGEASLPVILPLFNSDIAGAPVNPVTFWETVQNAKIAVAAAMTNVITVAMEDAEMDTDLIHYTPAGYLTRTENIIAAAITNGYI